MRLRMLLLCCSLLGLLGPGVARAAQPGAPTACAGDNLWAEQVLFAEAALLLDDPAAADDRCGPDGPGAEDCIDRPGLSGPRPAASAGRCDVRFGGAPRLHLRPLGARPSPWERALLGAAPQRLRPAGAPLLSHLLDHGDPALGSATLRPPRPPLPTVTRPAPPALPLAPGHRDRIERPPR